MKNEYKVNKALMMSWAKRYIVNGAVNVVLLVLWIFVGVSALALIALYAIKGGDALDWYIAIIMLLLSVYKLFISRFIVISRRYAMYARIYGVPEWTRTTEFTDTEIIMTDHSATTVLKYENIKRIKEYGNEVIIFFNDNIATRIYKDAFTEGSWEECNTLIQSKMK